MRRAFTLVELMVSIALVTVLMLGVGQVFKTTSATVAAGSAISDNTRVARGAQSVFAKDFADAVAGIDSPLMILRSEAIRAFRNRADDQSDLKTVQYKSNHELSIDLDGNNVEGEAPIIVPGERISGATYNFRNHRADTFAFFTRGNFRRVAGNPGQNFISPMTGTEAFVKYGHARLWDGVGSVTTAASFKDPGAGTFSGGTAATNNPTNFYATQWVLGRYAVLLKEGIDADGNGVYERLPDDAGIDQRFWKRKTDTPTNLNPLDGSTQIDNATGTTISESRVDLAGATISQYRSLILNYIAQAAIPTNVPPYSTTWYDEFTYRMLANANIPKPLTSDTLAQTGNVFIPGCTQFIVEYAGDYLSQDAATGAIIGTYADTTGTPPYPTTATDGKIDFVQIGTGAATQREIRWYGMPRDIDSNGVSFGTQGATMIQAVASRDVAPLRDFWQMAPGQGVTNAPFEYAITGTGSLNLQRRANYSDTTNNTTGMGVNNRYWCAWGPNDPKPKMIRITIVIDDPDGRLPGTDGQTFEYVYSLP